MNARVSNSIQAAARTGTTAAQVGTKVVRITLHDMRSRLRHGRGAPRQFEQIWFHPDQVTDVGPRDGYRSGEVRSGDWDLDRRPFGELPKVAACRAHWIDGLSWEDTGIYDFVLAGIERTGRPEAGCWTLDEIVERYRNLDASFAAIGRERRLKTRRELLGRFPHTFREQGGINVHIDRHGVPMFANGGTHRLVMAQVLGLDPIPGAVALVHADALPGWKRSLAHRPVASDR